MKYRSFGGIDMTHPTEDIRHFLRQWIEADVAEGRTGGKVLHVEKGRIS